jgi:hypothetical protein
MLYWNGSAWTASTAANLLYDDSLSKISLAGGSYIHGGQTGSVLYGLHSTRGSAGNLWRPDITSAGTTKSLKLGRHPFITDIIIGDGTGSDADFVGTANAYIRFTNYTAGVLRTSSTGVIIADTASALTGNSGKFLTTDGSTLS